MMIYEVSLSHGCSVLLMDSHGAFHRLRYHCKEDNVPKHSEPIHTATDVKLGTSERVEERKDLELVFQFLFLFVLICWRMVRHFVKIQCRPSEFVEDNLQMIDTFNYLGSEMGRPLNLTERRSKIITESL